MVDVQLVRRLADEAMVSLQCLKEYKEDKGRPLAHMTLLQKSRYEGTREVYIHVSNVDVYMCTWKYVLCVVNV
jgi:hypothetical protein